MKDVLKLDSTLCVRDQLFGSHSTEMRQLFSKKFLKAIFMGLYYQVCARIFTPFSNWTMIYGFFSQAVARSRNPTLVGVEGIVLSETENTFILVSKENRILSKFLRGH
jgi:hypothetical protein